jgi:hypothetical protein
MKGNTMNHELKRMLSNAEIVMNGIEVMRALAEKYPESPVDYEAIIKAQNNLLDAIHERICDIVTQDAKRPFWKKLFRK